MSQAIKDLIAKAMESIKIAKVIAKEESYGFATARAYYAMLYAAQALLLLRKFTFSKHSAVIAIFGKEYIKNGVVDSKFHRYLLDAFDLRQIGDYETARKIDKDACLKTISHAEEFIEMAKKITS